MMALLRPLPLMLLLVLPGCGGASGDVQQPLEPDPAIVAALAEPIMIDPDLATQNRGNAAIVIGSFDGVPAWTRDPDEIAAARAAAVRLAGGALQAAPASAGSSEGSAPVTLSELVAALPGGGKCPHSLQDGFAWAADLSKVTPIYPGGNVEQAAGAPGACALRAVRYVTAAERQDVLDFHYTLLVHAGYRVQREGDVLVARKGGASARIAVARAAGGMSEVALASAT